MTKEQFIDELARLAQAECKKRSKWVLPSVCIGQAALETGWGRSSLMTKANAFFGIKAGSSWKGKVYSAKTQECYDGVNYTTITDTFRAYDSLEESVKDYYDLITGSSRYAAACNVKDAKEAITAIHKGGYATSPTYVTNVMSVINSNNLTKYDAVVTGAAVVEPAANNKTRAAVVKQAASWIGRKEADGSHKEIIDVYNAHKPLARGYAVKYTDAWCATFVSAVAIKCGVTDVMPTECGCEKMIELYKKLGCWQENDAHVPQPADVIFYDWQDNGVGDNVGAADHVGIVESVSGNTITIIEGNYSDAVKRRTLEVNGRYIRGYGIPKLSGTAAPAGKKTVEEIAKEVLAGLWGNGADRKSRLTAAGYDYAAVQKKVNELAAGSSTPAAPVVKTHKVVKGDTLTAIAKKYNTTVAEILKANKSKYPKITANYIVIGWVLNV